jgi:hypothetical protein
MAGSSEERAIARKLLDTYGTTYAREAGIEPADKPQPLYRMLVLSCLLSARISSDIAVRAARALGKAALRSPRRMRDAGWQRRVDALGEGGYRRYDERTATQLGEGAELVLREYGGDLRRMRAAADGDLAALRRMLREVPGLGPVGVDIFLREVQGVWPEVAPYLDKKAQDGARKAGLPANPGPLARIAEDVGADPAVFAAALVRASLDRGPRSPAAAHH